MARTRSHKAGAKIHLQIAGVDCRSKGQTEFEYRHQAACGYVRDNVTVYAVLVDCKLCLAKLKKMANRGK